MLKLDQVELLTDVLQKRKEQIVYVVSAFSGVTNALIRAMDELNETDYSQDDITRSFQSVTEIHEGVIEKFFPDELNKKNVLAVFEKRFDVLRQSLLIHKQVSRVLMPVFSSFEIRDLVIGFGEGMAAQFLKLFLEQHGVTVHYFNEVSVDAASLVGGIVTDRRIDMAKRAGILHQLRDSGIVSGVRIFGGHMSGTPNGLIAHQGRGYSDIMAVDTALALGDHGENVSAIRFWKVVDGVCTANPGDLDPEKNGAVLHRDISVAEALESAAAGSGLINTSALSLAQLHGLDLQIRNMKRLDPDFGTNVVTGDVTTSHLFKVIASNPLVDAITITLPEMADRSGFLASIAAVFEHHNLSIDQIGPERTSMTFSIPLPSDRADREEIRTSIRAAMADFKVLDVRGEKFTAQKLEWDQGRYGSISVIGLEMRNTSGVLAELATTLSAYGINFEVVGQSKSQISISFLIDRARLKEAVQLLHDVFVRNDKEVIAEVDRRAAERRRQLRGTFSS